MADEYTSVSNKEHVSICIRSVDPVTLIAREDFCGFYEVPNIKSDTIVKVIKDALIRFCLPLKNLRGQTYDGASNMMGKKSGVATQIKAIQPKALATHCHGHSLNLAVKDVTQDVKILKNTMGTVGEICILVKFSPKREHMLGNIQDNIEGVENEIEVDQGKKPSTYVQVDGPFAESVIEKSLNFMTPMNYGMKVCVENS